MAKALGLLQKGVAAGVDDVAVPHGLNEGDALSHGCSLQRPWLRTDDGQPPSRARLASLSPIRTMTVGPGLSPDLLTRTAWTVRRSRADAAWGPQTPPVGTFTPP